MHQPAPRSHRRGRGRTRRICAVLTALAAMTLPIVGPHPATATLDQASTSWSTDPCALTRTEDHHSEGLDTWHPGYPRPVGHMNVAMIFLSFPGSEPLLSPRELAADHFPATTDFFRNASYGRLDLHVDAVPRWFAMPRPARDYGIQRDWDTRLRDRYLQDAVRAADEAVDFSRYDIVHLVADPYAPGVDSDATKVVNLSSPLTADGRGMWRFGTIFEQHPPDHNVLAHETAHIFDLPDLYSRPSADSDADWDTHVGDWDLMGSQFALSPDLFAWHKWKLGWLERGQIDCVFGPGATLHRISPVEIPGGTKLVAVRTGRSSVLAVEVRGNRGNDSTACTGGVLVYRVRGDLASGDGPVRVVDGHPRTSACEEESVHPPLADAPLGKGEGLRIATKPDPDHAGDTVSTVHVQVLTGHPDGSHTIAVTAGQ